jgi:hypothetical protein
VVFETTSPVISLHAHGLLHHDGRRADLESGNYG